MITFSDVVGYSDVVFYSGRSQQPDPHTKDRQLIDTVTTRHLNVLTPVELSQILCEGAMDGARDMVREQWTGQETMVREQWTGQETW